MARTCGFQRRSGTAVHGTARDRTSLTDATLAFCINRELLMEVCERGDSHALLFGHGCSRNQQSESTAAPITTQNKLQAPSSPKHDKTESTSHHVANGQTPSLICPHSRHDGAQRVLNTLYMGKASPQRTMIQRSARSYKVAEITFSVLYKACEQRHVARASSLA